MIKSLVLCVVLFLGGCDFRTVESRVWDEGQIQEFFTIRKIGPIKRYVYHTGKVYIVRTTYTNGDVERQAFVLYEDGIYRSVYTMEQHP